MSHDAEPAFTPEEEEHYERLKEEHKTPILERLPRWVPWVAALIPVAGLAACAIYLMR